MTKLPKPLAIITTSSTLVFLIIYKFKKESVFLTFTVLSAVFAYHFITKIFVGKIFNNIYQNNVNENLKIFKERKFEKPLYKFLKVRKWKDKMPSENINDFNLEEHTIIEVIKATCQAELVHDLNLIFALLPLILIIFTNFGAIIIPTSIISFLGDTPFIIIQRYNRPRLIKLSKKIERKNYEKSL